MSKSVTNKQVERMYDLFKGLHFSYGVYDMSQAYYEGKKLRGQPKSITEDTANEVFDKAFCVFTLVSMRSISSIAAVAFTTERTFATSTIAQTITPTQ